jgi:hypothetical protein
MKAVAAVGESRSHAPAKWAKWFAAIASAMGASTAFALAPDGPQLEVSGATLPRFDNSGATHSSRLDITLMPEHRSPSGIGFAFGVNNPVPAPGAFVSGIAPLPSVDFGIHWRLMFDSSYRFDVTAYRRVSNADAISLIESHDPSYGARIEMGFSSRANTMSKGFVADRGFVGFQLESGARVTFKRSGGVPMLYYRNTFY